MGNGCCKPEIASIEADDHEHREFGYNSELTNSMVHDTETKAKDDLGSSGYSSLRTPFSVGSPIEYPDRSDFQQLHQNTEEFTSTKIRETHSHQDDFNGEPPECSGLRDNEQVKIKRNFSYLKANLDPELLLDHFLRDEIIDDDQAEEVKSAGCRKNQADLLIRFLLRSRKKSTYSFFLNILNEIECAHIREILELEHNTMPLQDHRSVNIEKARTILENTREELVSEVNDPIHIAVYFVQYEEFSIDEYEMILQEKTRKLQVERLLDFVLHCDNIQRRYIILNHSLAVDGYMTLDDRAERKRSRHNTDRKQIDDPDNFYVLQPDPGQTASSSQDFRDVKTMRISLNIVGGAKKKHRKEKQMVKKANNYKIKLEINDALVHETECLITDIESGSIVIQIKGCKDGAISRLMQMDTEKGISKILHIFLSHPDICTLFNQNTIFQVTVDISPVDQSEIQEASLTAKKIITSNFEFLVEELDALRFLELGIFTEEEKEVILRARTRSRAEGTKILLKYANNKSENELKKFIDEIKQRKPFVWNHICSSESKEFMDDDVLTTDYKQFVENISPSVIIRYCVERGILHKSILNHELLREQCTKMVLQGVLTKNYKERNEFLHILQAFNQIPLEIQLRRKEFVKQPANQERHITGVIFRGTYHRGSPNLTESKEKPQQIVTVYDNDEADDERRKSFLNEGEVQYPMIQRNISRHFGTDSEDLRPILTPWKGPRCLSLVCFDEKAFRLTSPTLKSHKPHTKKRNQDVSQRISRVSVTPSGEENSKLEPVGYLGRLHMIKITEPKSTGICVTRPFKDEVTNISST